MPSPVLSLPPAHAFPSSTFWFPVPAILAASRASLPPSLSTAVALVPLGVAPAFCVVVLLLLDLWRSWAPLVRTHSRLTRLPQFHEDFTSPHDVDCLARGGLITALLLPPGARGTAPVLVEFAGTSWREAVPVC